jgi:enoyl-CoA hydratase
MPDDTPRDVTFLVDGHIGILKICRPEVRNALRGKSYEELQEAVLTANVRCLVVTGEDPAFCSGDDVRAIFMAGEPIGHKDRRLRPPTLTPGTDAFVYTNIPVVAAVNGAAVGWGLELAVMADLRVASERAQFGSLFVKRGLVADTACLVRIAQLVGRERAAELLLIGDVIDAEEAHRIGLISRVVKHEELMDQALALAEKIARNPPLAVTAIKEGMRRALDPDWPSLGRWVTATLEQLMQTEDHREGVRSFIEKREPVFVGR